MRMLRGVDRRTTLVAFVLGGIVSSELMWLVRTENKRTDYDRRTRAQILLTRNVIDRLNKGEDIDVEKELLDGSLSNSDDKTVNDILNNLESIDLQWSEAKPVLRPQNGADPSPAPAPKSPTPQPTNFDGRQPPAQPNKWI